MIEERGKIENRGKREIIRLFCYQIWSELRSPLVTFVCYLPFSLLALVFSRFKSTSFGIPMRFEFLFPGISCLVG